MKKLNLHKLFETKDGHLVVVQLPNAAAWAMIISGLFTAITSGSGQTLAQIVLGVSAVVWGGLELLFGVNIFRRMLGLLALLVVIYRTLG